MGKVDSIGSRIREARKAKGLSQEELGRLLGITKGAVSFWESGKNAPKRSAMPELAGILGVSERDLWEGRFLGEVDVTSTPAKSVAQPADASSLTAIESATLELLGKVLAQHKLPPSQCIELMNSWQRLLDQDGAAK